MTVNQVQNFIDYGSLAVLMFASIGCIKLGKRIFNATPINYKIYRAYVIAINALVVAFALFYKYQLK